MSKKKLANILKNDLFLGILSFVILAGIYSYKAYESQRKNPEDKTMPTFIQMWKGLKLACIFDESTERRLKTEVEDETPNSSSTEKWFAYMGKSLDEKWLYVDSLATLKRLGYGLLLGVSIALTIGFMMGTSRIAKALLMPTAAFTPKIIPTAAMTVFLVYCGSGMALYVSMIVFGIAGTLAISIYYSIRDVPEENISKALTLGASRVEIIWNVILPQILPKIINSIRLTLGPALVFLMAAENYNASTGLGARIRILKRSGDMSTVFPYLILIALALLAFEQLLKYAARKTCPWYSEEKGN